MSIVLIPACCLSVVLAMRGTGDFTRLQHVEQTIRSAGVGLAQAGLILAFLPYEAYISLDACLRTVGRVLFTRRRMLEWKTASDAGHDGNHSLLGSYRAMAIAPLVALSTTILLAIAQPDSLYAAVPLLVAWLASPWVAWRLSRPGKPNELPLTAAQVVYLHQVARQTWRFFETHVGPEDHWLPPDNYQKYPVGTLAHRTSPTNIGISLLSNLAAHDFGYISVGRLLERTAQTFQTMGQLERYHGHFLNWYDTLTLQPLYPKYVSTVDSGNLAGHILTLRSGLIELLDQPILSPGVWGLLDVTRQAWRASCLTMASGDAALSELCPLLELLDRGHRPEVVAGNLRLSAELLQKLAATATDMQRAPRPAWTKDVVAQLADVVQQCREHSFDLLRMAPWLGLTSAPFDLGHRGTPEQTDVRQELLSLIHQLEAGPTLRSMIDLSEQLLLVVDQLPGMIAVPLTAEDRAEREWVSTL